MEPIAKPRAPRIARASDDAAVTPGEETQRKIADFLVRVSEGRRLAARSPVAGRELDRSALIASVRAHVAREVPTDVIRFQGELLAGLGLIPVDFDYEAGTYRLLESQIAGFYEYRDKTMYLASDLDEAAAVQTLAHELVHALQDQHYDLGARLSYEQEGNDRESASQALAEGDATSAMIDFVAPGGHHAYEAPDELFKNDIQASMTGAVLNDSPGILRESLLAPYVDGLLFVHALRRRSAAHGDPSGWTEVDRAWKSPPETTEQLLHLDKYDSHEPAEKVPAIAAPSEGAWSVLYEDVFGEQGLRISAQQWMPKPLAASVAEGWGGDRLALFRRGGSVAHRGESGATPAASVPESYAVAWHIRFDAGRSDPDFEARQAFKALSDSLHAKRGGNANTFCVERGALGPLAVARVGRDIAVTAGPYERAGKSVKPSSVCPQTSRWAAEILRKSRP
ncbi:MAG: hypothetical protein ABW133_10835 [Polyangiaceae bacterium]